MSAAPAAGDIWGDLTCPVCGHGEALNCGLYADIEPDSPQDPEHPFLRLMTCLSCHKLFDSDSPGPVPDPWDEFWGAAR